MGGHWTSMDLIRRGCHFQLGQLLTEACSIDQWYPHRAHGVHLRRLGRAAVPCTASIYGQGPGFDETEAPSGTGIVGAKPVLALSYRTILVEELAFWALVL